jgi:hypothetical protein
MNAEELKNRINAYMEELTEIPSKKEFVKIVSKIYSDIEKGKDAKVKKADDGVEKKKRAPTPYNNFMKEYMAVLKAKEEETGEKMTAKAKMEYIASLWSEKKAMDAAAVKEEEGSDADEKKEKKKEKKGKGKKEESDEEVKKVESDDEDDKKKKKEKKGKGKKEESDEEVKKVESDDEDEKKEKKVKKEKKGKGKKDEDE